MTVEVVECDIFQSEIENCEKIWENVLPFRRTKLISGWKKKDYLKGCEEKDSISAAVENHYIFRNLILEKNRLKEYRLKKERRILGDRFFKSLFYNKKECY